MFNKFHAGDKVYIKSEYIDALRSLSLIHGEKCTVRDSEFHEFYIDIQDLVNNVCTIYGQIIDEFYWVTGEVNGKTFFKMMGEKYLELVIEQPKEWEE